MRVSIARQQVTDAGLIPAYSPAAVDGHQVENSTEKVVLHIRNASEVDVTVTIRSGYAVGGLKLQDRVVTVPAGGAIFVGPFDSTIYNQPGTSQVHIDYSAVEGVDVAALLIPCGSKTSKMKNGRNTMVVHHIDYNKQNNNPENLITLCNRCNSKVNFNREYWTQYFQEIMFRKKGGAVSCIQLRQIS